MNDDANVNFDCEPNVNPSADAAPEPSLEPDEASLSAHSRAQRLELSPWPQGEQPEKPRAQPEERYRFFADPVGLAAAVATLGFLVMGAIVTHDHLTQSASVDSRAAETAKLAQRVDTLKAQVEALDAARAHETTAEMRKLVGEIKADAATTRDFGAQLQQISQRIDRTEHEQTARLDKLGDRLDHDVASRIADLAARVDRQEKRSASFVAGASALPPAPPPRPTAAASPVSVSNDITGSIGKPKAPLRDYTLEDIRDGMALVESPAGAFTVGPGDLIPGAGRVIRIERRGRDWAVITDIGVIATPQD